MSKPKTYFQESAFMNNTTYMVYYKRLLELSLSMFEWTNVPETVDVRYLELALFSRGKALFFNDEALGFLGLNFTNGSAGLDVYRIPIVRRAYANNGYHNVLTKDNSVIIWNNYLHEPSETIIRLYAKRLYNLDRIIDVNANAQKTPVLIQGSLQQMLTLKQVYQKWEGNEPVIFGDKNLDVNGITVLKTDAPYVADKIHTLKISIWNEALTYLGISNVNIQKKERLLTDEVTRNMGGTMASRYSRLQSRREACEHINKMFGLDMWCDYRADYELDLETLDEQGQESLEEKEGGTYE